MEGGRGRRLGETGGEDLATGELSHEAALPGVPLAADHLQHLGSLLVDDCRGSKDVL